MEEGASMLYKIMLSGEVDRNKLTKTCDDISSLKDKPQGTYDLIWDVNRDLKAVSYNNDRLFWLAWQLEKRGFQVKWSQC